MSKLLPFNDMVRLALGPHGIMRDTEHPLYRELKRWWLTMVATIFDWHDLLFREIWNVDTEFYPGAGLANGATHGDAMTPLCLVALEMRSDRLVRLWQDEVGQFAPYRLDGDALIVDSQ